MNGLFDTEREEMKKELGKDRVYAHASRRVKE